MVRWFNFIDVADVRVKKLLDAIIFVANPYEKTAAHITIGGPFENQIPLDEAKRELIGSNVHVIGIGNFFSENQNTVYLRVGSTILEKHWNKKDFGYNPHLTLYDGSSKIFAKKLYEHLTAQKLFFEFLIGNVYCQKSQKGQHDFTLIMDIDLDEISKLAGARYDLDTIKKLDDWERLTVIDRISTHVVWRAAKRKNANSSSLSNDKQVIYS